MVGDTALNLLTRWNAHAKGSTSARNTPFAVFGVTSMPGRFADKRVLNEIEHLLVE
jgi:hypothetical protein